MRSIGLSSIQDLVQQLRKLDEAVFDETEPLRRLLQLTPVDVDSWVACASKISIWSIRT